VWADFIYLFIFSSAVSNLPTAKTASPFPFPRMPRLDPIGNGSRGRGMSSSSGSSSAAAHHQQHYRHQTGGSGLVPLAALIKEEARTERHSVASGESRISARDEDAAGVGNSGVGGEVAAETRLERPLLRYGCAAQCKKGEDFFLLRTDCPRPAISVSFPDSPHPTFAVFAVSTYPDISNLRSLCIHCHLRRDWDSSTSAALFYIC